MKQLNFFASSQPEEPEPKPLPTPEKAVKAEKPDPHILDDVNYWKLFVDGASRNNPGKSGAGVYILKNDRVAEKKGVFLGVKTNNQAEYLALLLGIFLVKRQMLKNDVLLIVSDSQLLVRQLEGVYRVKHPMLKPLHELAKKMLVGMNYDVGHVMREDNTHADALANAGIDKKNSIPQEFIELLQRHEITL